jgi:hypothetical protein
MLSSLCEQDLEVFFNHAMNMPDRRTFWLRYLSEIERTGCVLNEKILKQLESKLRDTPELSGAIQRAYRFRHSSDTQAFFLVFANVVVVEFSDRNNAAYMYSREFFTKQLEPRIQSSQIENARELKRKEAFSSRILHHKGWQGEAPSILSDHGIHPRRH